MSDNIEVDIGMSPDGNQESRSSSNSGGGGKVRSPISVSEKYGTSFYGTETECEQCSTRAVGVLVVKRGLLPEDAVKRSAPLCGDHRDKYKSEYSGAWSESEFRRFVDA